ncbi:MAG TPA: DUF1501 domain-containing protein [Pirellulales bacterium]|jgi:uncharacterized protein (DUF1501 family)
MNLWQHHMGVRVNRHGVIGRRDFLRGVSLASAAAGVLSWKDLVAARADELRSQGMACILLFMRGGPSQFETFSPKPEHENGGETKAIDTDVPGIQIAQGMPRMAKVMQDVAVIRSMTTKEGNHARAQFLMHSGYAPTPTVKYPSLGSIVAHQLADRNFELPSFVRVGDRGSDGGGGLLGVEYDAFVMANAEAPANTKLPTAAPRFTRRLGLLAQLESSYASGGADREVADHQKLYDKAARMVTSRKMEAFYLDQESDATRERYGRTDFGSSCLLARRLVESGVTFVEVNHGNWDTHDNIFERTTNLCGQIDQPMAALIADLKERGMLDKTLVIWMGEFGRTPKVNPRGGRDHFPRAFNVAMAGGGIRGGQVVGHTDAGGDAVTDHPVSVPDLFQTFCKSLRINPAIENMSAIGRPIKIVDGGQPVSQLFS